MLYKNIVCPVDSTGISDPAEEHAAYLSKLSGANVVLLNVVEKWYRSSHLVTNSDEWQTIHEGWLKEGETLLKQKAEKLLALGAKHVDTIIREGDAAHEIVATAFEKKADLIIMATHRYSPIGKIFIGSVTDRVSKKSPCPILWMFSEEKGE